MPTSEELEALPTLELRDRAFRLARQRLDVGFFWNLLRLAPAAEAAAGHEDEADQDIMSLSERVADVVYQDTPEEANAFRPIYVDYILEHEHDEP